MNPYLKMLVLFAFVSAVITFFFYWIINIEGTSSLFFGILAGFIAVRYSGIFKK